MKGDNITSFLDHHQIFVSEEITQKTAEHFIRKLTLLSIKYRDSIGKPNVIVWVSSQGGLETATLSMIDAVLTSELPLTVIGHGLVGSSAVWLYAAFPRGSRIAFPHTLFYLHEGSLEIAGTRQESRAAFHAFDQLNSTYIDLLARFTGRKKSTIRKLIHRDQYLSAKEAQALGIVDKIIKV